MQRKTRTGQTGANGALNIKDAWTGQDRYLSMASVV
jgi:hypothetical protein